MTHVITRLCIRGGECVDVCPEGSIVPGPPGSPEWPYLYIDPVRCIDCGACITECQIGAIFPELDVPAIYQEDIEQNRQFFSRGPGYWKFMREDLNSSLDKK